MKKVCLTKESYEEGMSDQRRFRKKIGLTKEGYEEGRSDQRGL